MKKTKHKTAVANEVPQTPATTYQQILDTDTRPVPPVLRINQPTFQGDSDIPVDRYLDRAFHDLEKQKIWKKVWQVACREEKIPQVGDVTLYEIVGISLMIVRTSPTSIKAYYNACPHQGRQLVDRSCSVADIQCPYHGFRWNLEGALKKVPSQWDYPQIREDQFGLPEVQVDTWGGFVFINMNPDAEPLKDFLGDLDTHFERYPLADRYVAADVVKVIRCNWKAAQEAFMDSYHTYATHPQILAATGDENSQYDVFGNYSRAMSATGVPSPHLKWQPSEDEMAAVSFNTEDPRANRGSQIPAGETFRSHGAKQARERLRPALGEEVEKLCDAELMDSFYFTVFPNFHPWAAYNHIAYRFLPYEDEHEKCIMQTWLLAPFKGERPPSAATRHLGPDDSYLEAAELGMLARIFHQDESNLIQVQKGMRTLRETKSGLTLGVYQYTKARHFHQLYEKHLAR